ncbi:protein-L-isoaspartate(D-aspartate) O-methyltransferase [Candidatus Bathyarchaeota archaeon]|nr:protein-L-isoaspartate(D-aspartate) O-methyltransferase [Candidatus Bathyarchaeota archaeon]
MGWVVPPPKKPSKTTNEFIKERLEKVRWLIQQGLLKSEQIIRAMLKVPREEFTLEMYRDYAYLEAPLPIPGQEATISCPHSYPLFYEALELKRGDKFLEVGTGSGYGAAIAREIVGPSGKVITIEIDQKTYEFAANNLEKLGYGDILIILGDGGLGYPAEAPYDKICITAACPKIPPPLIDQLKTRGKLVAPIGHPNFPQDLIVLKKKLDERVEITSIEKVLYVPLKGKYGFNT